MTASANARAKPELVKLWTYYNFNPFLESKENQGLIIDLATMLTQRSQGRFNFVVSYLPRKRVGMLLSSNQLGAVALVNPQWFPDTLMSSSPLLRGSDIIISSKHQIINDISESNVKNQKFIGVVGHFYPALVDVEIAHRQNAASITSLFKLVAKQRGDFAIVPSLVAAYHQQHDEYAAQLHYGPPLHLPYTRNLVMSKQHGGLKKFVDNVLSSVDGKLQWRAILERYHLTKLALTP